MTLELNVHAPKKPIVVEGAIPVKLSLRNAGAEPADVPVSNGPSPFEYKVLSEDGSQTLQIAGIRQKQIANSFGLAPMIRTPTRSLAAGAATFYRDDLAPLLLRPLAPGRYLFEAGCQLPDNATVRSGRIPVEVIVSHPRALVQSLDAACVNFIEFEFHRESDAVTILRGREKPFGSAGEHFRDLHSVSPSGDIHHLSVALEAESRHPAYWRWIAWLDGVSLYAGVARKIDFKNLRGPLETGLDSPELLPSGFGFRDGRATFLITGFHQEQRRIRLVTLPPHAGDLPSFQDVAFEELPDSFPTAAIVKGEDGLPSIVLSWLLTVPGSSGLVQASIDPATGEVKKPPRTVFRTGRVVVAASTEMRDLLLAPPTPEGAFTLIKLPAGDVSSWLEHDLPTNSVVARNPVDRWILPSHTSPRPVVLAPSDGRLWLFDGSGLWREIETADFPSESVDLWCPPTGQTWATWFSRVIGHVVRRLA